MWLGLNYNFHENRVFWQQALALFLLFAWKRGTPLLGDAKQPALPQEAPSARGPRHSQASLGMPCEMDESRGFRLYRARLTISAKLLTSQNLFFPILILFPNKLETGALASALFPPLW